MLFSDALLIVPEMFFCETFSSAVDFYDYNRLQDCVTALLALSVIRFDCILISAVRADCCTCQLLFSDVTMCACVCLHFSFGPLISSCAFANTPKYSQVKSAGGIIVRKEWIIDCHKRKQKISHKR